MSQLPNNIVNRKLFSINTTYPGSMCCRLIGSAIGGIIIKAKGYQQDQEIPERDTSYEGILSSYEGIVSIKANLCH